MFTSLRNNLGPLLLILCCPPFVMLMWYTNTHLAGSFAQLGQLILQEGLFSTLKQIWFPSILGSIVAWKMLIGTFYGEMGGEFEPN